MGIFRGLLDAFVEGWNKGKQQNEHRQASAGKSNEHSSGYDRDFEHRLLRARTEPMEIAEYCDDLCTVAKITNKETGRSYITTEASCECEDFRKNGKPCKHMIFLALQTGRYLQHEISPPRCHPGANSAGKFVPRYWRYYAGKPTGIGYTNLSIYWVTGRSYGTSEKTGKPTNRKRIVTVNAVSEEDAIAAAAELGVMSPYASVESVDDCPSYAQYKYLHGVEVPIPYFLNAADASALLTRYEDEDDDICPEYLFDMATKARVRVSRFQAPASVVSCIWSATPTEKKPALYCYAVYCRVSGYEFGNAPAPPAHPVFLGFHPEEKAKKYIQEYQEFGWRHLHGNALAYKNAVAHLLHYGMI